MDRIYNWATQNNMVWNHLKFQLLRFRKKVNIKTDTVLFTPNFNQVVERKEVVKDLGILIDEFLEYLGEDRFPVK